MLYRSVSMITIRDVARQAGVSVATVSRVLNNSALVSPDTREAVMKAVTLLGYRPNANAQALATQVSDTIGVVVMDVSDAFFGALVKAVDTVAQQHQKYVLIGNSYHEAEKERNAIEVLIRQRCSALIVHSKALSDAELGDFMEHMPGMVLINRIVPGYAHRCVGLDNVSGALMATRMLLNHGHQRIGYSLPITALKMMIYGGKGGSGRYMNTALSLPKAGWVPGRRICRAARRRWSNCWGATSV
jgi:LacI family transcriptional regulator